MKKISIDLLKQIEIVRETKTGSKILLDRTYYDNNGMSDVAKNPCKFWVFTRQFILKVTKVGRAEIARINDVKEIIGKNNSQMIDNLENYVYSLYDMMPDDSPREWIPDEFLDLKNAIKSGALKV